MPKKSEIIVPVDQAKLQRETYRNILTKNYTELNRGVKGVCLSAHSHRCFSGLDCGDRPNANGV